MPSFKIIEPRQVRGLSNGAYRLHIRALNCADITCPVWALSTLCSVRCLGVVVLARCEQTRRGKHSDRCYWISLFACHNPSLILSSHINFHFFYLDSFPQFPLSRLYTPFSVHSDFLSFLFSLGHISWHTTILKLELFKLMHSNFHQLTFRAKHEIYIRFKICLF